MWTQLTHRKIKRNQMFWILFFHVASCLFRAQHVLSQEVPICEEWTEFYNIDKPDVDDCDCETLNAIRQTFPKMICEHPSAIDVRVADESETDYRVAGQRVHASHTTGFSCYNNQQVEGERCFDYKIRFCCPAVLGTCSKAMYWTQWFGVEDLTDEGDDETIQTIFASDKVNTCLTPLAIEARLVSNNKPYIAGSNALVIGKTFGLKCSNEDQVAKSGLIGLESSCTDAEQCNVKVVAPMESNEAQDTKCKDYKVRLCCAITANPFLLKSIGETNRPTENEPEEEENLTESEYFFKQVEAKFGLNDDDDFVSC